MIDGDQELPPRARVETENSSRSRFLKRLGTFLLMGLGVALAPGTAKAAGAHCCKDTSCGPCTNSIPYKCFDNCLRQYCCICTEFHATSCFDTGCAC
jgi:hypothetical protein